MGGDEQSSFSPVDTFRRRQEEQFLHLVTSQEYQEALNFADSLIHQYPGNPWGLFLRVLVLNNMAIDYEEQEDSLLKIAESNLSETCLKKIRENKSDAYSYYYLGVTLGYQMVRELRKKNYLKAYQMGTEAVSFLEKAISLNPSLYDAYVGLGNYYYFRSKFSGILRKLGVVADKREEGIYYLQLAAEKGTLSRYAAISSLAWIAIDKEDYSQAIRIAEGLLTLYPSNRAFLWCLGSAQKKAGMWREALLTYQKLLHNIRTHNRGNYYNEVGCLHSIAWCAAQIEDWDTVWMASNQALNLPLSPEVVRSKKKDINTLKSLKIKAEQKRKNFAQFPNGKLSGQ